MRLPFFIFLMLTATLLAVISWAIALVSIDPTVSGWLGILLFFLALSLTFLGIFFLFEYGARKMLSKKQMLYDRINVSIRHAVFFTALILVWAVMQSLHLARWWNLLLLVVILGTLEFFFISHERRPDVDSGNYRGPAQTI